MTTDSKTPVEDEFPDGTFKNVEEPYREFISKTVFALLGGISLAFFVPLLYFFQSSDYM
jgi:hypothetical protein